MNYEMFVNEVLERVRKIFRDTMENYSVTINHVYKNNGIELDGLVICKEGEKIVPNIYLNSFYEKYREGIEFDIIIGEILELYYNSDGSQIAGRFDLDFTYESIKDTIVYKIINFKKNKDMLKGIPYVKFLDLAIIFQCNVNSCNESLATIRITNNHCKTWGVDTNELLTTATYNTPRIFPCIIRNIEEVIKDLMKKSNINLFGGDMINGLENVIREDEQCYFYNMDEEHDVIIDNMVDKIAINNSFDMYVFTNTFGINGAAVILYNGLLDKFANQVKKDLYVIPSSIHEVIVLPKCIEWNSESLREMVLDINETQVPVEDVLSSSIYEYSRTKKALIMV